MGAARRVFIVMSICVLAFNPLGVLGSWSASTVIDFAADFLEPGDDHSLRSNSDPLLDSIKEKDKDKENTNKVKKANLDGDDDTERFMVPMLSNSVGDNNQLMEYMTAAVMARATKRTLCLVPFFNGPIKHTGKHPIGSLSIEERYDIEEFNKFVRLSSLERCLNKCRKNIHGFWWLRHSSSSSLGRDWRWNPRVKTHDFGKYFVNWTSTDHINQAVEELTDGNERCVALGGLFPGLRWRGAYLAPSLYMRPSQSILMLANALQNLAIGQDQNFIAVHWRFEESLCQGDELGLCFLRCGDGAEISSGLHATTRGFAIATKRERKSSCKHMVDSTRVVISKEDLVSAIINKAFKENVSFVYIATDGWMRGSHAQNLIKEVVKEVRSRGLFVSGLWRINNLPNIVSNSSDYMYNDQIIKKISNTELNGHSISRIEQELCFRASSFMGSGESTWSLAVFRVRLASRRWKQLVQSKKFEVGGVNTVLESHSNYDNITEQLLRDSHAAGLQCRYQVLYRRAQLKEKVPQESYQDEAPDTWLDMEACEAQLGQGGSCKLYDCFP